MGEMMVDRQPWNWAVKEFGGAELGDLRRTKRLVSISAGMAERPGKAISTTCGRGGAQSVSRFFDCRQVDAKTVLSAHVEQSRERCGPYERILAIQDTTALSFDGRKALEGLGEIAASKRSRGLLLHSTMVVTEARTPLGIAGVDIWTRSAESRGVARNRRNRETSEKESWKWIRGLEHAEACVPEEKRLLVIGDRESDVFLLMATPRRKNTDILIRVAQDRALLTEDNEIRYLFDALSNAPDVGGHYVDTPRQGDRKARRAGLRIQVAHVTLKPPRHRTSDIPNIPVDAWGVRVSEANPPDDVSDPLEWMLLTTEPVEDLESAVMMVGFYTGRWLIEEYHHVLKTGCNVQRLQLDSVEKLKPAIAMSAVVAWRILYLTKYSRERPEDDPHAVASDDEILVLERWLVAQKEKKTTITNVREFVRAVALLGGFMGRKGDGAPGVKVLWQGMQRLEDLVTGYRLATPSEM